MSKKRPRIPARYETFMIETVGGPYPGHRVTLEPMEWPLPYILPAGEEGHYERGGQTDARVRSMPQHGTLRGATYRWVPADPEELELLG